MAPSKRVYKIIGRIVQVAGLCLAIYGVVGGLADVWDEPTFSKIVGGIVVLVGIVLSITSEAFLLLYAIEENTRETRRILEQVRAAGVIPKDAQKEVAVSQTDEDDKPSEAGAIECPSCGCPVRESKTKCPACGEYIA
jgi:hypothetical protein